MTLGMRARHRETGGKPTQLQSVNMSGVDTETSDLETTPSGCARV